MKVEIKLTILLLAILSGLILSQGNSTNSNNTEPSGPAPSGSPSGPRPSGKGPRPSGKGMRGENGKRPDGPRNLPPSDGGFSDKINNITDSKIFMVKNIIKYLPPVEQDLLAGKFNQKNYIINNIFLLKL